MASTLITFTPIEVAAYYRARLPRLLQRGRQWRGACALHGGRRPSFSVDPLTGRWHCFSECGRGGSLIDYEMAFANADFRGAMAAVYAIVGRQLPSRARMDRHEYRAAQDACKRQQQEERDADYFAVAVRLMLEGELERLDAESRERLLWTHILQTIRDNTPYLSACWLLPCYL